MDKETEKLIDTIVQRAAAEAVAKSREHDLKDLEELLNRIDSGFAKLENIFKNLTTVRQKYTVVETLES